MKKSKDERVQKLLDDTAEIDGDKHKIMQALRKAVFAAYPKTSERIMYGGIMFTAKDDWGGIFVRKSHISFEFSNGAKFKDPGKILEGDGKFRRHLKICSMAEIKEKKTAYYVKQAGK